VVGAFYYIRVVKVMFFDDSEAAFDARPSGVSFIAAAGALVTLLFALFTGSLSSAAASAARLLIG
jgi:NADH-quinone oxidoreductase subunit N